MNETETKRMIGAVCPTLNLEGWYEDFVPRVTAEQLDKLLGVAEQGKNAPVWSDFAAQFLQYGQQDVIAASTDRLVAAVKDSYDAAWALLHAPRLADEHRDALVKRVKESDEAAWVLGGVLHLSDEQRALLVSLATDSAEAARVLEAPHLTDEQREHLAKVARS